MTAEMAKMLMGVRRTTTFVLHKDFMMSSSLAKGSFFRTKDRRWMIRVLPLRADRLLFHVPSLEMF